MRWDVEAGSSFCNSTVILISFGLFPLLQNPHASRGSFIVTPHETCFGMVGKLNFTYRSNLNVSITNNF